MANIKIKLLRDMTFGAKMHQRGSVVSIPSQGAKYLIDSGRAEEARGTTAQKQDKSPEQRKTK